MIWLVIIVVAFGCMLFAYRKKRLINTYTKDEVTIIGRFLATDCGIITCGIMLLVGVILYLVIEDPREGAGLQSLRIDKEKQLFFDLGYHLANKMVVHAKEGNALVIYPAFDAKGKPLIEALKAGVKKGLEGSKIKIHTEFMIPQTFNFGEDPIDPISHCIWLRKEVLDALVQMASDCNVILCFVNIDPLFDQGILGAHLAAKRRFLGLVCDDVFLLGSAIEAGLISECIIPNPAFRWIEIGRRIPWSQINYREMFLEINGSTIRAVARRYPAMFYLSQKVH